MKYKAIFVDLDRTLLRDDKSLSDYTISVLKKCKDLGIKIVVASARPLRNVVYYDSIIEFDALVVSNGARIINGSESFEYKIPYKSGSKVIDLVLNNSDMQLTVETGEEAYSNVHLSYFDTIISDDLYGVLKDEGSLKMIVGIKDENTYDMVNEVLDDDVYCTIANNYVVQIMSKDATKWNGVAKVIELFGFDSSECMYFGDDFDDIKPIEKCGCGVAMENAITECREVSNYICKTNEEDGVAHFIDEYLFGGKL